MSRLIRTLKETAEDPDLKDREVYSAPPKYHTIKCKHCGKTKKVELKYTRWCGPCRKTDMIKRINYNNPQSWANEP